MEFNYKGREIIIDETEVIVEAIIKSVEEAKEDFAIISNEPEHKLSDRFTFAMTVECIDGYFFAWDDELPDFDDYIISEECFDEI